MARTLTSSWLAVAVVLGSAAVAATQTAGGPPPAVEAERDWTYGGFVDAAYLGAFNDPANKLFRSRGTAWHVDDWYLNMAGAYWRKQPSARSRWGAEVLLQSGKDDEIFGFSATAPNLDGADWLRHLGPTNVSYLGAIGNGLTVQGGIFTSFIGYDSLYAKDNLNYTRPWSADFTPYLMLGVNATYPFSEKLTGALFVTNGYWHLANANRVPSPGLQLAYKATPEITVKQTVLAGPHQSDTSLAFWRFLSNTIVERRAGQVVAALDFHVATERIDTSQPVRAWWVAAQAPLRWNLRGPWSVAVRPELAWDSDGRWTLAEQTVRALTTTPQADHGEFPARAPRRRLARAAGRLLRRSRVASRRDRAEAAPAVVDLRCVVDSRRTVSAVRGGLLTPFAVAQIALVLEGLGPRTVAAGLVRPDGLAVGAGITAAGILPAAAGMSAGVFALLVFRAVLLLP